MTVKKTFTRAIFLLRAVFIGPLTGIEKKQTRVGIHHPFEKARTGRSSFTAHPMYQTNVPVCRICKFGKYASGVDKKHLCRANRVLVWSSFMLAMAMNMNAALYLLPIVIVESSVIVEFLCKC
eukprot:1190385-Prorocentrum_minimum.AAC.2